MNKEQAPSPHSTLEVFMDFFPCRSKSTWLYCLWIFPFPPPSPPPSAYLVLWVLWAHQEAPLKTEGSAEDQLKNMESIFTDTGHCTCPNTWHFNHWLTDYASNFQSYIRPCSSVRAAFPLLNLHLCHDIIIEILCKGLKWETRFSAYFQFRHWSHCVRQQTGTWGTSFSNQEILCLGSNLPWDFSCIVLVSSQCLPLIWGIKLNLEIKNHPKSTISATSSTESGFNAKSK